jgi:hypothetical protein
VERPKRQRRRAGETVSGPALSDGEPEVATSPIEPDPAVSSAARPALENDDRPRRQRRRGGRGNRGSGNRGATTDMTGGSEAGTGTTADA